MPHLIDIERRLSLIARKPPKTVTFEASGSKWTIVSKEDGLTLLKDNVVTEYSEIRTTIFNDDKPFYDYDTAYGIIHESFSKMQLVDSTNIDTIKISMIYTDRTKTAIDAIKSRLRVPRLEKERLIFQYVTPAEPNEPYRAHMDTFRFEIHLNEPTATTISDTELPH